MPFSGYFFAPAGPVYQAGTLSGNPVAMAAGLAELRTLRDTPGFYEELHRKSQMLFEGMREILKKAGSPFRINAAGSLGCLFFTDQEVRDYASAKTSDSSAYAQYFSHMLNRGIYLAPSQFEAMFLSLAHTEELLNETLGTAEEYFSGLSR